MLARALLPTVAPGQWQRPDAYSSLMASHSSSAAACCDPAACVLPPRGPPLHDTTALPLARVTAAFSVVPRRRDWRRSAQAQNTRSFKRASYFARFYFYSIQLPHWLTGTVQCSPVAAH